MILVDPPQWPAHGTLFGHLVSDSSLGELHAFARQVGLPSGAFDHDHYDVPQRRYTNLSEAGATLVPTRELVKRLDAAGLRVRPRDRQPGKRRAVELLRRDWDAAPPAPVDIREHLLTRWSEPHRRYHDVRHLAQCINAVRALGGTDPVVILALWFHDAIYSGTAGADEDASADLAASLLAPHLPTAAVADIARLVRLTATHSPDPDDHRGAWVNDADLSIFAVSEARYHVYARDVRQEYAHLDDDVFVRGRADVLTRFTARPRLFHTPLGRDKREHQARANLTAELDHLATGLPLVPGGLTA